MGIMVLFPPFAKIGLDTGPIYYYYQITEN